MSILTTRGVLLGLFFKLGSETAALLPSLLVFVAAVVLVRRSV